MGDFLSGGLLLIGALLIFGILIVLQLWLAKCKSPLYGWLQPIFWLIMGVVGNALNTPELQEQMGEVSSYGGAFFMAITTLLVYLVARRRAAKS